MTPSKLKISNETLNTIIFKLPIIVFLFGFCVGFLDMVIATKFFRDVYSGIFEIIVGNKAYSSAIYAGLIWIAVAVVVSVVVKLIRNLLNRRMSLSSKSKIIISFSVVIVIYAILFFAIWGMVALDNTSAAMVKKYDRLVELISSEDEYDYFERDKIRDEIVDIQKDLGLYKYYFAADNVEQEFRLDEEFIVEYLKVHSFEDFLSTLDIVEDELSYYDNSILFFNIAKSIETAAKISGFEIKNIELSDETLDGYYKMHMDEYPPTETWYESGRFYSSSGENGHTEEKECKRERTYYGDFALEHSSGYNYDKGRYEWVNGKFYDELPSWEPFEAYHIMYKGRIQVAYGDTLSEIMSKANSTKYFVIGDDIVFIHYSSIDNMTPWRKLSNK